MKHVIRVYELMSFINGSSTILSRFIKKIIQVFTGEATQNQEVLENNHEFDIWDTKDKIVMSWIYSLM